MRILFPEKEVKTVSQNSQTNAKNDNRNESRNSQQKQGENRSEKPEAENRCD